MELADLFKKKEPENYVEQASGQQSDPLLQFLSERTVPSVYNAPKPQPRPEVSEEEVSAIAQEYTPKPMMPEQQDPTQSSMTSDMSSQYSQTSPYQQFIPTSDLVDVEKIKKQAETLVPKQTSWQDALANLTPLAVELLMGGKGGGSSFGIAGQATLSDLAKKQAKRDSLEAKLMELKQLKTPKFDTEAGKQARFEAAQKEKRSLADRQLIVQTRDKLNQDMTFKAARARYNATNDAINVLNQRNPIGDASVKTLFAKGIFAEVGAMSDKDKADFIGSPALERRFDTMVNKYKNGLLDEGDRADLIKLAAHMRERAKKDSSRIASSYTKGLQSFGIDPSSVIDPLLSVDDISPQFAAKVGNAMPDTKTMYDKSGNAYKVKLNKKTGKYEYAD